MRYLPKFKWHHLTEKVAAEGRARQEKMRAELSQVSRERGEGSGQSREWCELWGAREGVGVGGVYSMCSVGGLGRLEEFGVWAVWAGKMDPGVGPVAIGVSGERCEW